MENVDQEPTTAFGRHLAEQRERQFREAFEQLDRVAELRRQRLLALQSRQYRTRSSLTKICPAVPAEITAAVEEQMQNAGRFSAQDGGMAADIDGEVAVLVAGTLRDAVDTALPNCD